MVRVFSQRTSNVGIIPCRMMPRVLLALGSVWRGVIGISPYAAARMGRW